jgi:hypothetical protein
MIRRGVALAMLLVGLAAMTPLAQMAWGLAKAEGPIDSESYLFFLLVLLPAIGSGLIVGAIWLYMATRRVRP